jgi:signal transduction histidine kinase
LVALIVVLLLLNIIWSNFSQEKQAKEEMLEKAQILAEQLGAFWQFMDNNQSLIDTDADGSYNFKGLNCVIAGKQISRIVTEETDYIIKYTNTTTRQTSDSPDSFELEALAVFSKDHKLKEYYALLTSGEETFRYTTPIWIEESCLKCHGEPVGALDALGYPKEGMREGDLAGILSISMPVEIYLSGIRDNIAEQSLYFFCVALLVVATVYLAFSRLVARPLSKVEEAATQLKNGNMLVDFSDMRARGEIRELANRFQEMAAQLNNVYTGFEEQVAERTDQLKRANQTLEDQRIALQKAKELLERENEYKSEFLAIMSHELRTPLTAILAFIDIWETSHSDLPNDEMQTMREIKENGSSLLAMVTNILEVARAEAGKTELLKEPLDMVDLVTIVEREVSPLAQKKRITLDTRISKEVPIIYADREKIRRIVENLVSNAIKYTPEGGRVGISIDICPSLETIKIEVSDTGVGIPQEDLALIFEQFQQSSATKNMAHGGSGLGLAVVKQLAEAHDGEVFVESKMGTGSTFTVVLPILEGEWEEIS